MVRQCKRYYYILLKELESRVKKRTALLSVANENLETEISERRKLEQKRERLIYEGTGIGLANCIEVVDRQGGAIWVESVWGQGAYFKFTLGMSRK
ncbi:MAG: ATP-binding protein [Nitrospinota bacterium]